MGTGYVVEGRLGRGGMGVVDLAVRPDGSRVALKRLALHGSAEALASARARLRREAEVLGRLEHRRIVRLLDVIDDGDDVVLVMPWMQGGSLADRVAQLGPLPPEEVRRMAEHLLGALAAAHRAGVVHRDLKPANILFDGDSRPHLADFGVATARDLTAGLTGDGRAIGTPGFISPEQARGEPATPASDVFSLGATLRWAVTGVGPYGTGDPDVLLWRAARNRIDGCPRALPEPLRRQLDRMLEARPERRPTAAAAVGGPDGTVARAVALAGRRPRRAALVGALAAAGVAAATVIGLAIAGAPGASPAGADREGGPLAGCVDLPYRPCGALPAPGTDGERCLDERADYDGDTTNGCEAVPDDVDGTALGRVEATIVPAADVDEYPVEVVDNFHFGCDGRVTFDLTAPAGMSLRLEVLDDGGEVIGETTSADGVATRLQVREPQCAGNDAGTITARVSAIGTDRSAATYALERSGSW